MGELGFWVLMSAWFGCIGASAVWWDRNLLLRFLPVLFGLPAGLIMAWNLGRTDPVAVLLNVGTGMLLGAVFWSCVWLEVRFLRH